MTDAIEKRSQVILRMPVDQLAAIAVLHDGERADVLMFIPPGEDLGRMLAGNELFLPVTRKGKAVLLARAAIAAIGVAPREMSDDLPLDRQAAAVKLRSGTVLSGELRWPAHANPDRTADYLNGPAPFIEIHSANATYYVVKTHIASVEEV